MRLLRPGFALDARQSCASTAASASAPSASSGCAAGRRAAAAGRARPGRRRRRPAAHAGRPHRQRAATSRATRCAIVANSGSDQPPAGFDPQLSSHRVLVQGRVPVRLRLRASRCPARPTPRATPDIDYLAKDYHGLPPPDARPAEPAGAGLAASARPPISASRWSSCWPTPPTTCRYRQDAIANEAYLATARQRVSVRRHARLVDYFAARGLQRARLRALRRRRPERRAAAAARSC